MTLERTSIPGEEDLRFTNIGLAHKHYPDSPPMMTLGLRAAPNVAREGSGSGPSP